MQHLVYESKPVICFGLAAYALSLPTIPTFGKFLAIGLMVITILISYARLKHRGYLR